MAAISVKTMILGLAVASLPALQADAAGPAPWPTVQWPQSTPAQQGLDGKRLDDLVRRIADGKEFPDLHSLLVVRNGYLVVDEYFSGHGASELHTLQSVSKSFTSALVGIAIEQGQFKSTDEKVLAFFPEDTEIRNLDQRKRDMKLVDLLTMRTGTDYNEGYDSSPHSQLNQLDEGWDEFVLGRKMVRKPGTYFQYDSGGVILLSGMLQNRTGTHADRFADRSLFPALGISEARWYRNREGHPHTGGGLHLRSQDMAKFGLLYLRGGVWEERQVVPSWWVEESTRPHVSFDNRGRVSGYGYLWWILDPDPKGAGERSIYAAMGFRGQYIFVIPEHDLVVVVTGGTSNREDERRPIGFLYSDILPAVQR